MKNFALLFVAFMALIAMAYSADCVVDGHSFSKGEHYSPPGKCIQYTCVGEGGMSAITCPQERSAKPCKEIPGDLSKPYPDCCPRLEC